MPKPDIPKPTDPEPPHFHPGFKTAAEEAIKAKGLSDKISVLSQFRSPTGPIDLVLFNKKSGKVLLPIKIKRSQTDVRGGGRRQARDDWMLSIFGPLQLELIAAGQEGMRKLEVKALRKVRYPDFLKRSEQIEKSLISTVKNEPSLLFSNTRLRPSDHLWAEVVCPSNPAQCLEQAFSLFQELVDERIGMG